MPRRFYRSVVVPGPLPDDYSYPYHGKRWQHGEFHRSLSIPQKLELSKQHAHTIADRLVQLKTPISVAHQTFKNGKKIVVGRVEDAIVDEKDGLVVTFSLDTKNGGQLAQNFIQSGFMSEVSLQHNHTDLIPLEISICKEGCRTGTSIKELNESEYKPGTRQNNASAVIVSATREDMMMAAAPAPIGNGQQAMQIINPPAAQASATSSSNPQQQQQQAAANGQAQQQQQQPAASDPQTQAQTTDVFDSAMKKLASAHSILTKAEKKVLMDLGMKSLQAEDEKANTNAQQTEIIAKQLLDLLSGITGKSYTELERPTAESIMHGDGNGLNQVLGPALVAASSAMMQRMSAGASYAAVNGGAQQQQQQFEDPDLAEAYNQYESYKKNRVATAQSYTPDGRTAVYNSSSIRSLPPVNNTTYYSSSSYSNPAIVSASRESMNAQEQQGRPFYGEQPAKRGPWSALPSGRARQEMEQLSQNNYGTGFKPSQVLSAESLASMGAPVQSMIQGQSYYR
jgi:hypothetical protein